MSAKRQFRRQKWMDAGGGGRFMRFEPGANFRSYVAGKPVKAFDPPIRKPRKEWVEFLASRRVAKGCIRTAESQAFLYKKVGCFFGAS